MGVLIPRGLLSLTSSLEPSFQRRGFRAPLNKSPFKSPLGRIYSRLQKSEHGCRLIYAGVPSAFGLGLEGGHIPAFFQIPAQALHTHIAYPQFKC